MRSHTLIREPLRVRVWRAIAIGFSVTALALNAFSTSFIRAESSGAQPGSAGHSRPKPAPAAAPFETVRPSASPPERAAAPNDAAALDALARRFSDAADADLSELAGALAAWGGARAHQVLFTGARSSRPSSQAAALEALATVDTPDVREFMLVQLNERQPLPAVLSYFADCQETRALPALERLAREAPSELRSTVISSLFSQGDQATPVILRLLRGDDELSDAMLEAAPPGVGARRALRQMSVQRLRAGAITQGRVFDFLEQDLSSEARDALLDAAHEPASAARAVTALANRGDRASLSALERLADDADRGLGERATCALRAQTGSRTHRIKRRFVQ